MTTLEEHRLWPAETLAFLHDGNFEPWGLQMRRQEFIAGLVGGAVALARAAGNAADSRRSQPWHAHDVCGRFESFKTGPH